MKQRIKTAARMITYILMGPLIGGTGYSAPSTTNDNVKAVSLVRTALRLVSSANPKTARIHGEGKWISNNQGLNPHQPMRSSRLSADWEVDFQNHWFLQKSASYRGKELSWCSGIGASREMRYSILCHSNVYINSGPEKTDETWTYQMDTTYPDPYWHLAHALERSSSLQWEGQSIVGGRREDVVSYTDEFRHHHLLFFNAGNHLLREVSTEARITKLGEGFVPRIVFLDYRRSGSHWSPARVSMVQNSFVTNDIELASIRRDYNWPSSYSRFAPPVNAIEVDPQKVTFHVSEVAKSVYFVENASFDYNCMFVVFADYVLVVEAPWSDNASTKVMAAIHEIAPGKPIRYIVTTHFHEDHIGGLRAYLRAGATLVTTPGNLQFMDVLMKKLKATEPSVNLPAIEVIADKRRFTDGSISLDLLTVRSPHADEMVVPVIASDGIVYVADGFTRDLGPWRPVTVEERVLASEFKRLELNIRILLLGHGAATTREELDRFLASDRALSQSHQSSLGRNGSAEAPKPVVPFDPGKARSVNGKPN